jgi:hypothetical protein
MISNSTAQNEFIILIGFSTLHSVVWNERKAGVLNPSLHEMLETAPNLIYTVQTIIYPSPLTPRKYLGNDLPLDQRHRHRPKHPGVP